MTEDHGLKLSIQIDIFWKIRAVVRTAVLYRSYTVLCTYAMALYCKKNCRFQLVPAAAIRSRCSTESTEVRVADQWC